MIKYLEIISKKPSQKSFDPPLVFIHGAWHSAWCWNVHFLPYFEAKGFEVYAISLRGHGKSRSNKTLRNLTIADYVEDVRLFMESLDKEAVLIGHSMGGFIVQKYLEKYPVKAAVLLTPVPSEGVIRTVLHIGSKHFVTFLQMNFKRSLYPIVQSSKLVKNYLYHELSAELTEENYQKMLQDESYRAFWDMLCLNLPLKIRKYKPPICLIAAKEDGLFSVEVQKKTATFYQADYFTVSAIGHVVMLEKNWETVAALMINWLKSKVLD